ncbi:MAG TPA: MFS transporter [Phycisphaerae bacterium]|nr:MFS transporter [Phycisphaerae bacterium]HRY69929.1 MFS transporter [Phycisphaerae bacterium]
MVGSLPYASVRPPDSLPVRPPKFRLRRGRNWFFIGLTYASYYFNRYNLAIAKTDFCQAFGFSNVHYSYITAARSWSYAVGLVLNGLLADRFGGKTTMAVGGYGTAVMNLLFGLAAYQGLMGPMFGVLGWFVLLRGIDGYLQAFGAPGMVKTNTAWFARRERGRFAGIFGLMINLGRFINNTISPLLLTGFTIWRYQFPGCGWQWVFFVPAGFVTVITTLMLLLTRNTPEEAGYVGVVQHEDGADRDGEPLSLIAVARTIMVNPFIWLTAGAYFCTGVVRYGVDDWFPAYFREVQKVSLTSFAFQLVAWGLPLVATMGSILSGYVSDLLFQGRRAPVAAALYFIETVIILIGAQAGSSWSMTAALLCIAFTCNSTHSILGTAAPMDIGGRQMAGFATGFIDAFQYLGAGVAGLVIGWLIDHYGWGSWLYSMAGFGVLGGVLMLIMWSGERRQGGMAWTRPPQVKA